MSLIFATQLTAIATALLAVGAIVTAAFAFLAFRKQAEEVRLLQEQARRDIEQRRRAQAVQVYISVEDLPFEDNPADMRPAACLRNESALPVYDIVLGLGDSPDQRQKVLLPGKQLRARADWRDLRGFGVS